MPRSCTSRAALVAVLAAVVAAVAAPSGMAGAHAAQAGDLCGNLDSGVQCGPGNNRQTPGGGDKVPHTGWPAVSGILWKVLDSADHHAVGGPDNDELLGHHGSDALAGGAGNDILWGDWDPTGNTTGQRDVLRGGAGDDWIYPSHGPTTVSAGAGDDHIWAFYGKGTIDCGPGRDVARIRENGAFRTRNCERIQHFCQYGSNPDGSCRKPGETLGAAAARRTSVHGAHL
jgi:hemolysin type calcium-binding protein